MSRKTIIAIAAVSALTLTGTASANGNHKKHKPKPAAPVVTVVAAPSGDADRYGFCDQNGRFWDLVNGQQNQSPWTVLQLTPAKVGLPGNPNAIYC